MIIEFRNDVTTNQLRHVRFALRQMGLEPIERGDWRHSVGAIDADKRVDLEAIQALPGIASVRRVKAGYKRVSKEWQSKDTVVTLDNGLRIGGDSVCLMAGPCSVENEAQLMAAAEAAAEAGGGVLRGGAYKPRTSPYAFQGLGVEGLRLLVDAGLALMAKARDRFGLALVSEAVDTRSAQLVAEYADIIQIGARNMMNFELLKFVGTLGRPVMLKRGMSATINEFLLAAEYIVHAGNPDVILCERGLRTFSDITRNVLDLSAVPVLASLTHLPVVIDPSHGTGLRHAVTPMSRAAVAAGAHGVIVEVHPDPANALSDGPQSLLPEQLLELGRALRRVAVSVDRSFETIQRRTGEIAPIYALSA